MAQNIFKIYDGRTSFWQWDTGQKLIVLDETVTEVHFSNRNMEHSKRKPVYEKDGMRLCNIPDLLLQLPKNLIAYAYARDEKGARTLKSVKYAVVQRPIPTDYVCGQDDVIDEIVARLDLLEALLKDVETGTQQFVKFEAIVDAAKYAGEKGQPGDIIVVKLDEGWVPHVIEDDKSLSPICNCDGEMVVLNFDGDDANGLLDEEIELHYDGNYMTMETGIQYYDGGGAAGYKN